MTDAVKTAVLLAAYNGEKYIAQQIDSILAQTWQDFTLFIHDDGSADRTGEILADYETRCPDRIRILRYAPSGSACRNFFSMLQRVEAAYYFFSDQDDVWLPDKLESSMALLRSLEEGNKKMPALVFSDLRVVDESLIVTAESYLQLTGRDPHHRELPAILRRNSAAGCTIGINRACKEAALTIGDIGQVFMHDWWLFLTAAACGRTAFIDRPLVLYRQHGGNVVGASRGRMDWLKEKAGNILRGEQLARSREGLQYRKNAVEALQRLSGLKPETQHLLKELSGISSPSKAVRIRTYIRYRLMDGGLKSCWKLLLV